MRTVDYIELRAKALVSELSQAWDFEKRRELREVLNDLENAEESPSNAIPFGQLELVESDLETKQTCTKLPRKPRGYREGYINNVLDYIEERESEGYLEGDLYAEQFNLDFSYFSSKLCPYLNQEAHKRNRFIGYRIGFENHDDRMHYVLMKKGATHANA